MAERAKALRLERSPALWAWVQIPLLTKFIFCNYDNYCLQYHAGPSHLSRILKLLKSWIFCGIVVSQDGRAVQGAAFRAQSSSLGVGSNPTSDKVHLLQLRQLLPKMSRRSYSYE